MISRRNLLLICAAVVSCAGLLLQALPAHADYRICNRTSYVLDAALAIEQGGATATQGWFRVRPGECSTILSGNWAGERYFLHTRTPDFYGETPEASSVSRMFCVGSGDFLLAGAQRCDEDAGTLAPFTEVRPDRNSPTTTSELTETPAFDLERARHAGMQRLLYLVGQNPGRMDGEMDDKSSAALTAFVRDQRLNADALSSARLIDALIEAARERPRDVGITLCNDMDTRLIAAFGLSQARGTLVKGWYDLPPGACERVSHKPVIASPIFAYAQAIDEVGNIVMRDGAPIAWSGRQILCTKTGRFEFSGATDCAAQGWNATPFRAIDTMNQPRYTVRFKLDE